MTKPYEQWTRRDHIEATASDLVVDFLFYDRKGDEALPVGAIEEAVKAGEITVEEIVTLVADGLRKALTTERKRS